MTDLPRQDVRSRSGWLTRTGEEHEPEATRPGLLHGAAPTAAEARDLGTSTREIALKRITTAGHFSKLGVGENRIQPKEG